MTRLNQTVSRHVLHLEELGPQTGQSFYLQTDYSLSLSLRVHRTSHHLATTDHVSILLLK